MLNNFFKLRTIDDEIDFSISQKTILLDITAPLLMTFEHGENVYIIYVTKYKRLAKQLDFLIALSSYEEIENVVLKKQAINVLFKGKRLEKQQINLKSNKYEQSYITSIEADKCGYLPKDEFFLDKKYPNKTNLDTLADSIKIQKKILNIRKTYFKLDEMININTNNFYDIVFSRHIEKESDKCGYLPKDEFFLDKKYPNKTNLDTLADSIKIQKKILNIRKTYFKLDEMININTNNFYDIVFSRHIEKESDKMIIKEKADYFNLKNI